MRRYKFKGQVLSKEMPISPFEIQEGIVLSFRAEWS